MLPKGPNTTMVGVLKLKKLQATGRYTTFYQIYNKCVNCVHGVVVHHVVSKIFGVLE